MPDETGNPVLVGFGGLPVEGGAGLRRPIYRCADHYFAEPDDERSRQEYSMAEFDAFVEAGQITELTGSTSSSPRSKGNVVLYAHHQFLQPGSGYYDLDEGITARERPNLWIAYVTPRAAAEQFVTWSAMLFREAEANLGASSLAATMSAASPVDSNEVNFARALNAVQRARFILAVSDAKKRFELFVLLYTSMTALGRDTSRLRQEAKRELGELHERRLQVVAWKRYRHLFRLIAVSRGKGSKTGIGSGIDREEIRTLPAANFEGDTHLEVYERSRLRFAGGGLG